MNQQPKLNTFIRVPPFYHDNIIQNCLDVKNNIVTITNYKENNNQPKTTDFQIPQVLWSHSGFVIKDGKNVGHSQQYSGQEDVYNKINLNVQDFLNGERQAIITTGACCSGKSYTMFGDMLNQGVFYQFCQELFNLEKKLHISIIQIVNNKIIDLLEGKNINQNGEKKKIIVTNINETFDLIQQSISKQSSTMTMMNGNRFIHHTFIYVNLVDQQQNEAIFGDLSSSERIIGNITKDRLKEISDQNESIMLFHQQLEQMYGKAINSKQQIVYSKKLLNKIMEEIINTCIVDIIFCIHASYQEYNETYNLLKLAEISSKIKIQQNNIPKLNDAEMQMIQEIK